MEANSMITNEKYEFSRIYSPRLFEIDLGILLHKIDTCYLLEIE